MYRIKGSELNYKYVFQVKFMLMNNGDLAEFYIFTNLTLTKFLLYDCSNEKF